MKACSDLLSPPYEAQGGLVSRLIIRITRVTIWPKGVMNPLTKSL